MFLVVFMKKGDRFFLFSTVIPKSVLFCQDAFMQDLVPDIKARIDVVDLVAEYVPLKPSGAGTFKGLCPFHQERTPSFHVSRIRQSWHCFGCDVGGDIFTFIERVEGMEFREALTFLAQKAGVVIPETQEFEQSKTKKKRLHEVNELAAKFFRAALLNLPQAADARAYVAKRQIDDLSADLFLIGYAPESWSALTEALAKKGVLADELIAAGLAMKREQSDGVYDRFRGRLMFPIADVHGNIVGFTGRILVADPTQPKYINTPETPVYHKSAVLYGLDKAKAEIRKQNLAVIVEGNMDVVSSHQAGVMNVVAASGTALTLEQLTLIKRFTTNLAIAFDQDAAGAAATLRGLDLARQQAFSIKIISLPPEAGKDPDEACKKDPNLWKQAIANAQGIIDWVYQRAFARHPQVTPEHKRLIAEEVLPEMARIPHPVEREAWVKRLASDLDIREDTLRQGLSVPVGKSMPAPKQVSVAPKEIPVERRAAWQLFALALQDAGSFATFFQKNDVFPGALQDAGLEALYVTLQEAYCAPGFTPSTASMAWSQTRSHLAASLGPNEVKIYNTLLLLAEHAFSSRSAADLVQEFALLFRQQRQAVRTRLLSALHEEMKQAEAAHDDARVASLASRYSSLTQES